MKIAQTLTAFASVCCALVITAAIGSAGPSPAPVRGNGAVPPNIELDRGIARPANLVTVSAAGDCTKLGDASSVIDFCESAVKLGYLLVHWTRAKSPCGATICMNADAFHLVHKSGGGSTLTTWSGELATFERAAWKNGDCFVVRAHNTAANLESADSTQTCVGLNLVPVPYLRATPSH